MQTLSFPAEIAEEGPKAGQRQADDVEVAALDARNVAAGDALNGVSAGFVEGLAGSDVGVNLVIREQGEGDAGDFVDDAFCRAGASNDGEAGVDFVDGTAEKAKHAAGAGFGLGLAEKLIARDHHGIGSDKKRIGGTGEFVRGGAGLAERKAADVIAAKLAGTARFVEDNRAGLERDSSIAQNFGAAGRGGGKDEFHGYPKT